MLPLMPALRTELQRLVIAFLILFDEPLEADVAADLEAQMVALLQEQQCETGPLPSRNGCMQRKSRLNAPNAMSGGTVRLCNTSRQRATISAMNTGASAARTVRKRILRRPSGWTSMMSFSDRLNSPASPRPPRESECNRS